MRRKGSTRLRFSFLLFSVGFFRSSLRSITTYVESYFEESTCTHHIESSYISGSTPPKR